MSPKNPAVRKKPAAAQAKRATTKKVLVSLSVDIEVFSPDRLRKFIFSIKKTRDGDKDNWKIDFMLLGRDKKADDFVQQIKIAVAVALKNVPMAEATALRDMTVRQKNYVNTIVAAAADSLEAGEITEEQFAKLVARTFRRR